MASHDQSTVHRAAQANARLTSRDLESGSEGGKKIDYAVTSQQLKQKEWPCP